MRIYKDPGRGKKKIRVSIQEWAPQSKQDGDRKSLKSATLTIYDVEFERVRDLIINKLEEAERSWT